VSTQCLLAARIKSREVAVRTLLKLLPLCILAVPKIAEAQDAKSILHNMISAYRGLTSYQGQASVSDRHMLSGGKLLAESSFTSSISYLKPNKLKIDFAMPTGGRSIYYDGATLTLYQDKFRSYSTAAVVAPDLQKLAPALLKFQVASKLDVLYFLSGNEIPSTLTGFERKPDQTRNGKLDYVIAAREPTSNPKYSYFWTWYIDKQTNLLDRIEARLPGIPQRATIMQGKKSTARVILIDRMLAQNIVNPQPNAKIDSRTFVFKPPPGSSKTVAPPAPAIDKGP
jgi:outer membrane lipoprotein-sorting protein